MGRYLFDFQSAIEKAWDPGSGYVFAYWSDSASATMTASPSESVTVSDWEIWTGWRIALWMQIVSDSHYVFG